MMKNKKSILLIMLAGFQKFEQLMAILLSIIVGLIILMAMFRLITNFYHLLVLDIKTPGNVSFEDYQQLFGKIMTLLISLEFMSSIIKVLKKPQIRILILDVILITALAISRKLIIFDYEHHDYNSIIAMGVLLISTGIAYFLFKYNSKQTGLN